MRLVRIGLAALFLCTVVTSSLSAAHPAKDVAGKNTAEESVVVRDEAWPSIAKNQDRTFPFRIVPITNGPIPDPLCPDPCVGGTGCVGWDFTAESVCRSVGGTTYQCEAGYGRRCAWKELSSGLITCKTCEYPQ